MTETDLQDPAAGLLEQRRAELVPLAGRVMEALENEVGKLGFPAGVVSLPGLDDADFSLRRDPYSGEDSLEISWRGAHGGKIGSLLFHGDGSFFAEVDIVKTHPTDARWFVEGVSAWGRDGELRSEPKLMPIPGA